MVGWRSGSVAEHLSCSPSLVLVKKKAQNTALDMKGLKGNVSKLIYNFCVIPTHCIE